MNSQIHDIWLLMATAGLATVLAIFIRRFFLWLGVPALVGYLLLGMLLAAINRWQPMLGPEALRAFEFLGSVGVFCLLFRIGLESNLSNLLAQLRRAIPVWIGNVVVSGASGFLLARYLLEFGLVPSLYIGIALTATSVGVSLAVWREAGVLDTPNGDLLVDVAELDDLSGIALMVLLFAVAPILLKGDGGLLPIVGEALGWLLLKAGLFLAFCLLFTRYIERSVTGFFKKLDPAPDPMLLVVGVALMIAAMGDRLGFSLPLGALFAGLIFSRDPDAIKVDASFSSIFDLFTPFFFVWIGLSLDIVSIPTGLGIAGAIFVVAVLGKIAGTMLPAASFLGASGALVLGVSLVPRAEIAMVIVAEGRKLGDEAMPPALYTGVVLAAAATCVLAPIATTALLRRWPPAMQEDQPD